MGLVFIPVYISYLGLEAWGLVGFMSMMQAWFTLLDMGLTPTLSREMARFKAGAHSAQYIRDLMRSMEIIYCIVAVAVVVFVYFIAQWVSVHWLSASQLSSESLVEVISIMGLVLAARMLEQVYRGAIQGLQRQVWLNGALGVMATLRWGGAVGVLAWIEDSVEAFFIWQGLISLLTLIILASKTYHWLAPGERPARFDLNALMNIRRFAGGMATTTLLALLLTQVDKLLLSKLVTLEQFGCYTLSASAAGALYFLVLPIYTAVMPRLTELVANSNKQELIETYHQACQWLATLLIPVALVMTAFAEPLLYVWTGNASLAQEAGPLFAILALGTLFHGFMYVPYAMQLAEGWTGLAIRMNLLAVCFIVPTILWAVPNYGVKGAAWVWLILNVGYVLIGAHFMYRRILICEKLRWYLDAIFKPLFIGSIVVFSFHHWITLPQERTLIAAVILGVAVLASAVVFLSVPVSRFFILSYIIKLSGNNFFQNKKY